MEVENILRYAVVEFAHPRKPDHLLLRGGYESLRAFLSGAIDHIQAYPANLQFTGKMLSDYYWVADLRDGSFEVLETTINRGKIVDKPFGFRYKMSSDFNTESSRLLAEEQEFPSRENVEARRFDFLTEDEADELAAYLYELVTSALTGGPTRDPSSGRFVKLPI